MRFLNYFASLRSNWLSQIRVRWKFIVLGLIAVIVVKEFGLLTHVFERNYYSKFSYPLDIKLEDVFVALKTGKVPPVSPINTYDYRFTIKNEKKCKQNAPLDQFDNVVILYVIKSALYNIARREAIRKTWGWEDRFSDVTIRRIFVLGKAGSKDPPDLQINIYEEFARNRDLIQADFLDTYYNNTIKTMMGFKWVIGNCPKAQFIMFADDDMYVSTKNLLKFIRNPFNEDMDFRKLMSSRNSPSKPEIRNLRSFSDPGVPLSAFDGRLLAGYVFFSSPMRHRMSRWYISLDEYPYSKYPPYVTAGAYVVSYPALEDMYYTSMYTKHFKFDDVYLGIVAKKCGIQPLHNENFYFYKKPYGKESYDSVVASHGFGEPTIMRKVWEEQRSSGHA